MEGSDSIRLDVIEVEWRRRNKDSEFIPTGRSIFGASEKLEFSEVFALIPGFIENNLSAIILISFL